MDQETMLHHLEELAEKLGIDVRYESAAGRVGMGMLRGKRVAVIDSNLRVNDRVAALCTILAGEQIGEIYVPPAIRKRIDRSSPLRVRSEGEDGQTLDVPTEVPAEQEHAPVDESATEPSEGENRHGADPEADAEE